MSDASSVVDRAAQAVENADAQADGTTPPSNEVQAQERIGEHENRKAAKAAAKRVGAKPAAKPAKPAAEKKPPKYDDDTEGGVQARASDPGQSQRRCSSHGDARWSRCSRRRRPSPTPWSSSSRARRTLPPSRAATRK